jgi:hypothetical protein
MSYLYHIDYLLEDDTEIEVSGTVKKNPFFTRSVWAAHYAPDEEPHDIEIKSELPDTITDSEREEIKELLFEAWSENLEPVEL